MKTRHFPFRKERARCQRIETKAAEMCWRSTKFRLKRYDSKFLFFHRLSCLLFWQKQRFLASYMLQLLVEGATINILRNNLRDCYRKEGVNHFEACSEQAEAYIAAIKASSINVTKHVINAWTPHVEVTIYNQHTCDSLCICRMTLFSVGWCSSTWF